MRQALGKKKLNVCSNIVGKPVIAAYVNDGLPHNVALARTNNKDAFFIHLKKRTFAQYVRDGKFLMHKILEKPRAAIIVKGKVQSISLKTNKPQEIYSADNTYKYNEETGKWDKVEESLTNIRNYFATRFTQIR